MTKILYKPWTPTSVSAEMVMMAEKIIEEYQEEGYTLTLRQLYYQFVARDIIENSERSYKNLGSLITKARMAGMISWEAIEDRNREHHDYWFREDEGELIGDLYRYIRFDQWREQPYYIEVWVEKEALGNIVSRACSPYLVPYMSCKGYLSASEAWRAGQRFESALMSNKKCLLIHLGDHDPSGVDMTRDNKERIDLFTKLPDQVEVNRVALNIDQINEYSPPPNPAKITDSRAKEYIKRYGRTSWELDALEPQVITDLIKSRIAEKIDWGAWRDVENAEEEKANLLKKLYEKWHIIKEEL